MSKNEFYEKYKYIFNGGNGINGEWRNQFFIDLDKLCDEIADYNFTNGQNNILDSINY